MHIPECFARQLHAQHDGQLRIRWSKQINQFVIEQKVSRATTPHRPVSEIDDDAIRARDGYAFILSVTPGDRAPCPRCRTTVKVPVMQMKFAKCHKCMREFRACYYPLSDALLEHLRYIDLNRGAADRILRDLDRAEEERVRQLRQKMRNEIEAATKDEFTRLFEIQSVGYTGRERAWIR